MYLVDTSVWIDHLRGRDCAHVEILRGLLPHPLVVGITLFIYAEILQGARNPAAFHRLRTYFGGQRFHTLRTQSGAMHRRPGCILIAGERGLPYARRWIA